MSDCFHYRRSNQFDGSAICDDCGEILSSPNRPTNALERFFETVGALVLLPILVLALLVKFLLIILFVASPLILIGFIAYLIAT